MRSLLTFVVLLAFLDARESPAQDVASSVDSGIAIVGATVIPLDGSPPLSDATVVIYGDRSIAVGPHGGLAPRAH